MKRFLAALLVVCLCLSMAGCSLFDGFKYIKAMNLYEEGAYEEAMPIFVELVDYADSQTMAALCKQRVDYAEAERLFAAGDYRPALELYTSLMLYEDSPVKAVRCQYAIGLECLESGAYEEAVSWFGALGGYEDSPDKMNEAKWLWLYTYIQDNGALTGAVNPDGTEVLTLSCADDGALVLSYKAEGYLLGVPYLEEMTITFARNGEAAAYTAHCTSTVASKIVEDAAGTLIPGGFATGSDGQIDTFLQTITVEDLTGAVVGEPTTTEDPAQALLVRGLFAAVQAAVADVLPTMLEGTGVAITVQEIGFPGN